MRLTPGDWTILEIVKLAVSLVTPLTVVWVGFWINRRLKEIEQINWANQKVVEKRIQFYFDVVPQLNDLLCFFTYVGTWKETSPTDVVALKRTLDKRFYIHAPLFPPNVLSRYFDFVNGCYKPFTGWGHSAKIKSDFVRRKESNKNWQVDWESLFVADEATHPKDVQDRYNILVATLAESLGIGIHSPDMPRARVPGGSRRPTDSTAENC